MNGTSVHEIRDLDSLIEEFFDQASQRFRVTDTGQEGLHTVTLYIPETEYKKPGCTSIVSKYRRPKISRSTLNRENRMNPIPTDYPSECWKYSQFSLPPEPPVSMEHATWPREQRVCPRCGYNDLMIKPTKSSHSPQPSVDPVAPLRIVPMVTKFDQDVLEMKSKAAQRIVNTNVLRLKKNADAIECTRGRGIINDVSIRRKRSDQPTKLCYQQRELANPYLQSPLSLLAALALTPQPM